MRLTAWKSPIAIILSTTLQRLRSGCWCARQILSGCCGECLTLSITVSYDSTTVKLRQKLERVVKTASKITRTKFPTVDSIFESRVIERIEKTTKEVSHPVHKLFQVMQSGLRLRSSGAKSTCHQQSFYPTAIRTINEHWKKSCMITPALCTDMYIVFFWLGTFYTSKKKLYCMIFYKIA